MKEKVSFKNIWHTAGIAGLVLASISIAYLLAEHGLSLHKNTLTTIITGTLQVAKIAACIIVLRAYMRKFKADFPLASRKDVRRMGTMTALLSALIFAAASMAFYTYHPDVVSQAIEMAKSAYGSLLDANAKQALEMMEANFPKIIFGYTLVYCFLFGWILSAILAPKVAAADNFEEEDEDEEEE